VGFQRKPPKDKPAKAPKTGRSVDARKQRKALLALERARREAAERGADLSIWETEFLGSVEGRIGSYGSAFRDPHKGALEEPLSNLQRVKLKEIEAKAAGKEKKSGFGRGQGRGLRAKRKGKEPDAVEE
jgi:hypothetical protein